MVYTIQFTLASGYATVKLKELSTFYVYIQAMNIRKFGPIKEVILLDIKLICKGGNLMQKMNYNKYDYRVNHKY